MRIGLVLPTMGAGVSAESIDAGAETAARLGWSSIWVTDHLMVPAGDEVDEYGCILEALTALTWVGARFPSLTLGTSVVVPAMRDGVLLAKELATIDVLSGGRLIVGVGVSDEHDLPEYTNLGHADRFRRRGAYLDETIAMWRHLWAGRTDPFDGEFHQLGNYTFAPLPPQGAAIPIWSGGRSARAVQRAALLTDGYHAAQTGPTQLRARWPGLLEAAAAAGRPRPSLSIRTRVKFGAAPGPVYSLVGTPDDMLADLREFEELGVDDLVVVLKFVRPEDIRREVERFDREVVVPFRQGAAGRPAAASI